MGFKAGFLPAAFLCSFPAPTRRPSLFRGAFRQPEDPANGDRGAKPEAKAATERDLKARFPALSSSFRRPVLSFPFQIDFPSLPVRPGPETRAARRKPPEKDRSSR